VRAGEAVVPASVLAAARAEIAKLQRVLSEKTQVRRSKAQVRAAAGEPDNLSVACSAR